jgi:hypothetical protein
MKARSFEKSSKTQNESDFDSQAGSSYCIKIAKDTVTSIEHMQRYHTQAFHTHGSTIRRAAPLCILDPSPVAFGAETYFASPPLGPT